MTADETAFRMRPGFKVLGALVLLLAVGAPLAVWWQGRVKPPAPAFADAAAVRIACTQAVTGLGAGRPADFSGEPALDGSEWAWVGTVTFQDGTSRPFSCAVPDGGAAQVRLQ
ncbi:hypothetical protein GCM10008019_29260 [Deinococcus soli (ex Cha et al. 2016)]|nr:hypothetical protein GCM10008019_29260 [Deinococcus soli (ex Cha et al. 2016)]